MVTHRFFSPTPINFLFYTFSLDLLAYEVKAY